MRKFPLNYYKVRRVKPPLTARRMAIRIHAPMKAMIMVPISSTKTGKKRAFSSAHALKSKLRRSTKVLTLKRAPRKKRKYQ